MIARPLWEVFQLFLRVWFRIFWLRIALVCGVDGASRAVIASRQCQHAHAQHVFDVPSRAVPNPRTTQLG